MCADRDGEPTHKRANRLLLVVRILPNVGIFTIRGRFGVRGGGVGWDKTERDVAENDEDED